MTLETPVLVIGRHAFTVFDIAAAAAALSLLLLVAAVILAWRGSRGRAIDALEAQRRTEELELRLAELSGSLQSFAAQAQGNTVHLQRTLDEKLDAVGQRVGLGLSEQTQRTAQSLGQLNERLAVIHDKLSAFAMSADRGYPRVAPAPPSRRRRTSLCER